MSNVVHGGTVSCVCGYKAKHIGQPPTKCPKCGAGREQPGLNRKLRRQLARQLRHSKRAELAPDLEPPDAA
jgi:hypothetical protein